MYSFVRRHSTTTLSYPHESDNRREPMTELDWLYGQVRLQAGEKTRESRVVASERIYSAHVGVAPSSSSVKLSAAGFGSGLKPLGYW